MYVGLVLGAGLVVDVGEEGRKAATCELLDEGANQLHPLRLFELDRQRHLQLVDDAGRSCDRPPLRPPV